MIRTIDTNVIIKNIKEMCIEANHFYPVTWAVH